MKTTPVIILLILCVALMYSCGKSTVDTPYTKLEGNWAIIQTATDDNGNGQLDNEELRTVTDNETMQFRNDSTGTLHVIINGTTIDYVYTWAFINNYTELRRIAYGEDTTLAKIVTLTTKDMTLMNYTDPQLSWYVLRKK